MNNPSARRNTCLALTITACLSQAAVAQTTISLGLSNQGSAAVEAGAVIAIEVRATLNASLVAVSYKLNAAGPTASATLIGRDSDPMDVAGFAYISRTSQEQPFDNNLPHQFEGQGPISEVFLDLLANPDGIPAGTDVLVQTIHIRPSGMGTLTITITDPAAATTTGAPDGVMFTSATIDPTLAAVTLQVYPPLDCESHPPPDPAHPDSDGDTVPDVCDKCPNHDDRIDGDGDGIPTDCDNCPTTPNDDQSNSDTDAARPPAAGRTWPEAARIPLTHPRTASSARCKTGSAESRASRTPPRSAPARPGAPAGWPSSQPR